MKAYDIIRVLNEFCNPNLIDSWDNTGFQIGNGERDIRRILIALDLDESLIEKAIAEKYDMIITHHPVIFRPLKSITTNTYLGRLIIKLISNDILVYNAHSNLDLANGGVNDVLAQLIELKNYLPLNRIIVDGEDYGYGRVGDIELTDCMTFIEKIKKALMIDDLRVYGDVQKEIQRVAVCGGSGGDFIEEAYSKGADIYITGDIKYHEAQLGLQLGLILVDAGHFHTEKIILPVLRDLLKKEVKDVEVELSMRNSVSYRIY